jgi:hypothetical protein
MQVSSLIELLPFSDRLGRGLSHITIEKSSSEKWGTIKKQLLSSYIFYVCLGKSLSLNLEPDSPLTGFFKLFLATVFHNELPVGM